MRFLRGLKQGFDDPRLFQARMPDGTLVLAEPVEHVPFLALGVWVRTGSRDENPEEAGITHFIEHLVFKGSRRRSGFQMAKRIEAIGGQVDAYTTKETTCFYARVFEGHRRRAVEILGELLCQAAFTPEMIRREVGVVEEEIQSYEDSPEELIHDLASEVLWPGHPLGTPILGTRDSLGRINSRRVRRWWRERYAGPNVVIAAAGRIEFDALVRELQASFRFSREPGPNGIAPLPRSRSAVRHEERALNQSSLCLVRRGPSYRDRSRHVIGVLNTILGAGASSRLYQTVREEAGLAYSVYSFLDSYRDTGMFGIYAAVGPGQMERVTRIICRELRRLRRDGVKRWELESAKAQIFAGHFLSYESMYERIGRLAHNEIYYGRQVPLRRVVESIEQVTVEDVHRAAEELLDPARFSLVTLGPGGYPRPGTDHLDF